MHFLLGSMSLKKGDHKRAISSFKLAQAAIPVRQDSRLQFISLVSHNFSSSILPTRTVCQIFGWDFDSDKLAAEIQSNLCQAMHTMVETLGEEALTREMTANWHPSTLGLGQLGYLYDECLFQISLKSVSPHSKPMVMSQQRSRILSARSHNTPLHCP